MQLTRFSDRIYYLPFEERTDRPNLYYICGDRYSVAIDAGNSAAHVAAFYEALHQEGLAAPRYTLITHWHWDHTFGLHALPATTQSISTKLTGDKLRQVQKWTWNRAAMKKRELTGEDIAFCNEHILIEYPDLSQIQVTCANQEIDKPLTLNPGGITVTLIPQDSTHSRDALFIHIPEEEALFLGDADCEDFYDLPCEYDPERLKAMIAFLESIPYKHHFLGHAHPSTKEAALAMLRSHNK